MKILNTTAIAALLACSMMTQVAPALADPLVVPIADTTGMTPQQVCDALLRPNNPNSEFTTLPEDVVYPEWQNVGIPTFGDGFGPITGVGTPHYDTVFLTSGFYRNGGSPNVWGGATATEIYDQSQQMHYTTQHQTRTVTFGCHVHKDPNSNNHIEPNGLQSAGNSTVEQRDVPGEPINVISETDLRNYGTTVNALICISPNNVTKGKPGTWTGKNGFLASRCDAASAAAGGTVPSGNAPFIG